MAKIWGCSINLGQPQETISFKTKNRKKWFIQNLWRRFTKSFWPAHTLSLTWKSKIAHSKGKIHQILPLRANKSRKVAIIHIWKPFRIAMGRLRSKDNDFKLSSMSLWAKYACNCSKRQTNRKLLESSSFKIPVTLSNEVCLSKEI